MAFSERLNLEILTRFNEAGIEFAFPSQTIYLAGDGESASARKSEG
jgi:small-conductance mechanosensitive channel